MTQVTLYGATPFLYCAPPHTGTTAAENEPTVPAPVLMLFSPGLKVAELVTPARREALGVTFGWFLRVGIAANAAYYFALFLLFVYLLQRRRNSAV